MMRCSNKLLAAMFAALIAVSGCGDTYLDKMWKSNVEHEDAIASNAERIARLQAQCDTINRNIDAMKTLVEAMQNNDYVAGVRQVDNGYRILFRNGGYVDIFNGHDGRDGTDGSDGHDGLPGKDGQDGKDGKDGSDGHDGEDGHDGKDGKDASAPVISMRQAEDGAWYWTLDGEFMTDAGGLRIPVYGEDAAAPQIRMENGRWQVSCDGGKNWSDAGQADGLDGDTMFAGIDLTDTDVLFRFRDGMSFSLPRWNGLEISLDIDGSETGVEPCKEIQINYQLNYSSDATVVTAASDGNYRVKVQRTDNSSGRIIITSPKYYEDGHVSIIASDGSGYSAVKVVNFYKRTIYIAGLNYTIPPQGGSISVPVSTNFEYVLKFRGGDVPWLGYQVKPMAAIRNDRIELAAEMNKAFKERNAVLELYAKNDPSRPLKEINIIQSAAVWRLERNRYMLNADACALRTSAVSTSGLAVSCDASWLKVVPETSDNIHYSLDISVEANETGARRSAEVVCRTSDSEDELGVMSISQVAEGEENPDDMIFKVRAYALNSYTSKLPLCGIADCIVDWGDGSEPEHVTVDFPSHRYPEKVSEYTVHVSGNVRNLNSQKVDPSIVEVIQWGNTGLEYMSGAFDGDYLLVKIPGDVSGAFSNVRNFDSAFKGCAFLESVPEDLFVSAASALTFGSTFNKCASLKTIPAGLFRSCAMVKDMNNVFSYSGIEEIPETLLSRCTGLENVGAMFAGCESLKNIPQKLFWNSPAINDVTGLFERCGSLEAIPEKFFCNNSKIVSMVSTFAECRSLKALPADLFAYFPDLQDFWQTFLDCSSLETLPASLFDNNRKLQSTQEMFFCCGITGESPYTIIDGKKVHLYERWMYPDWFYPISRPYNRAFTGNNFIDQSVMPENWRN